MLRLMSAVVGERKFPSILVVAILLSPSLVFSAPLGGEYQYLERLHDAFEFTNEDQDGDGVGNDEDQLPFNPFESMDSDGDGLGNNVDTDDDGDGMPDTYELSNNLNPHVNDALQDFDKDGANNYEEYQVGTDPSNLLSCSGTNCLLDPAPSPATISFPPEDAGSAQVAAIEGHFSVSTSGSAEYSVPLYTPSGLTSGTPKIALQYSSNAGNGIAGEGWTLGPVSVIYRCPQTREQDGKALAVKMAGTDRFCIDGERLVLVNPNAFYGGDQVEYRTESDSLRKIVSYSDNAYSPHPHYFKVWHKDGSVSEYGNHSPAKVYDAETGNIKMWALNKTESNFDHAGGGEDRVLYIYSNDPGVDGLMYDTIMYARVSTSLAANIRFYYEARPDTGNISKRLKSVDVYGGNSAATKIRTYELSYLDVTGRKNKNSRLSAITECRGAVCLPPTQFTWSDTGIDFSIASPSPISNLSNFPLLPQDEHHYAAADYNGDGRSDLVWLEPSGSNYRFMASPSNGTSFDEAATHSSGAHDLDSWWVSDFNQDGYPDILFVVDGSLNVYINTLISGHRSFDVQPIQLIANLDMGTEPGLDGDWFAPKGIFADINADGLIDVMYNKAIYYMERDPLETHGPYKFGAASVITLGTVSTSLGINNAIAAGIGGFPSQVGSFQTVDLDSAEFSGDFNGDGMPDMVVDAQCVNGSGVSTRCAKVILYRDGTSTWKYFGHTGNISILMDENGAFIGVPDRSGKRFIVGDVNRDGYSDIVWYHHGPGSIHLPPTGWYYQLSTGRGMSSYTAIWSGNNVATPTSQLIDAGLLDVNLDGFLDFVYHLPATGDDEIGVVLNSNSNASPYNYLLGSTAYTFATVNGTTPGNHSFIDRFGDGSFDINGDGILDFVDFESGITLGNKAAGTAYKKITKITNGFGEEINIQYDQLSNSSVYTREFDAAALDYGYPVVDVFAPINVVSEVSRSSPTGQSASNLKVTSYQYQGLKAQPAGRGSLGFRVTRVVDDVTGTVVSTSFRQDYPFIGLVESSQTFVSGQTVPLSETANSYTRLSHINGLNLPPYLVAKTQTIGIQRIAESSPSASSSALTINGVLATTTTTHSNFDAYGSPGTVTTQVESGGAVHTTTTQLSYTNSPANWILGLVSQRVVTTQQGASINVRTTAYTHDVYGRLLTEVREPDGSAAVKLTTSYEYDVYGNVNKVTEASASGSRYTRYVYDASGRYIDKTYNGLEQLVSDVVQRNVYGAPETVIGLNGQVQHFRYDTFGRQTFAATSDGASTTVKYALCTSVACPSGALYRVQTTGNDGSLINKYHDLLKREVRSEVRSFSGDMAITDTQYDAAGRVSKVSIPYFEGDPIYWVESSYDDTGRVIKVVDAQNGISTNSFGLYDSGGISGLQQLSTNQLGQDKTVVSNGLGQTVKVIDALDGYINYTYDAVGNLVGLNANGITSAMEFDVLGRRTGLDDPDQGEWTYQYNAFGELVEQQDSAGGLTTTEFDVLGRMSRRRDYTSGMVLAGDTQWLYGVSAIDHNVGLVVQESEFVSDFIKLYAYDNLGRLLQTITSLGEAGSDGDYIEYQTFDQYGRQFQVIDATGKGVQSVYNAYGYLEKSVEATDGNKIYHAITETNARGQITGEAMFGTQVQVARGYSPQTGLPTTILASSALYALAPSGATLLDISLAFDAVGNLAERSRQVMAAGSLSSHVLNETFAYDQLNRLTQVSAGGQAVQSLSYDATGNILSKTGVGTYTYGAGSAGPHAVTSAGSATYTYDAIGNMLTGDGRMVVYNVFRKPVVISKSGHTTTFAYGPDRKHYKRIDSTAGVVTTTLQVGNVEFIRVGAEPVTTKRYVRGVAVVTDSTVTGHQEHALLTDHIGSTVALAEITAIDLVQMDYDAYGKRRNLWSLSELAELEFTALNKLTTTGFTGHEMVDQVGLIHMQGRVYDPKLGRFMSADPYITELDNTQNMNRYSYVYNNPLTIVDPSGFAAALYDFFSHTYSMGYGFSAIPAAYLDEDILEMWGIGYYRELMDRSPLYNYSATTEPSCASCPEVSARIGTPWPDFLYQQAVNDTLAQVNGHGGGDAGQVSVGYSDLTGSASDARKAQKAEVEVLIYEPVGWGVSSAGHVATRVGDKIYTFGPDGMTVLGVDEYMAKNNFRSAVGNVLNISEAEVGEFENYLATYAFDYDYIQNCGAPVILGLASIGHNVGINILPVSLGNALLDSGLVSQSNFYPQTAPRDVPWYYPSESAPWAR